MKDLFNDRNILSSFQPVSYNMNCSNVKYKKMHSQVINMSYFDFLKEKQIVMDDGRIKGDFDEYFDGIQLSDRLRKALLWEESDYFMELQEDKIQNEFIFKMMQMLAVGGSLN